MENLREIVSKNLINLRKESGLTQVELGKKINYSDKAISRWEKGEVLPDLEILQTISKIYGVPLSYLLEEQVSSQERTSMVMKKVARDFFAICIVWTIFTTLFVYLLVNNGFVFWQAFVWCIPITVLCLVASWWKAKKPIWLTILLNSLLCWTSLTAIYLQLVDINLWVLFIVGIPIQATIITAVFFEKSKRLNADL